MRSTKLLLMTLLFCGPALPGCGPDVSEEDLGTIVTEFPMVPGAETPYPLPDFGTDEPDDDSQAGGSDSAADAAHAAGEQPSTSQAPHP